MRYQSIMPSLGKPGKRDLSKEKYWRDTVARWRKSGLSKTAFCKNEGVKINALCSWEAIIRSRDQQAAGAQRQARYKRAAAERRALKRSKSTATEHGSSKGAHEFVQVRVGSGNQDDSLPPSGAIEIIRPDGLVIRMPADLDIWRILALLNSLSS
jgi:hypothetical protein